MTKLIQKRISESNEDVYFFYRDSKKKIVPVFDKEKNIAAKKKLAEILTTFSSSIPKKFKENWDSVKLFDNSGNVNNADSILLSPEEGAYCLKNKLNHLTGKEWTKFSCSWFIFNALQKDLKEEREVCKTLQDHPATYSPTMMENFITFFTKEGMSVLDPFSGIGSTLVGCKRTNRVGYGVELNPKYHDLIVKRVPEFKNNVVCGDSRKIKELFSNKKFDFCISSPPYWDVLNRSTDNFQKDRLSKGLDFTYSDAINDLGNLSDYSIFLKELSNIYLDLYDLLNDGAYLVIIVKNLKKGGKIFPLAWDLASVLSKKYTLKDEKIWIQDKVGLAPYGYPSSWTSNVLHHYCIILRKEERSQ